MTSYLLDTSVISMLAPGREEQLSTPIADWLRSHDALIFIPCIAVAALAQGISKLRGAGGATRADRLDQWLDALISGYGDRILTLDAVGARLAGRLSDEATAIGRHAGFADVAIAALAKNAGHLLLTRNLKHFEALGLECLDPMLQLPP